MDPEALCHVFPLEIWPFYDVIFFCVAKCCDLLKQRYLKALSIFVQHRVSSIFTSDKLLSAPFHYVISCYETHGSKGLPFSPPPLPPPKNWGRLLTGAHSHIHGKRQCESYVPYPITRHREPELLELRGIPGLSKSADSWKNISATSPGEVGFNWLPPPPPTPKLKYHTKD